MRYSSWLFFACCCHYSNFTFVPEKDNVGDYSDKIPERAYKKVREGAAVLPPCGLVTKLLTLYMNCVFTCVLLATASLIKYFDSDSNGE